MSEQADGSYEQIILETMGFVESHCEKNLSLESLAERANISPYHFHRLFRAHARQPIGEFIRQVRLQKGARLLRLTESKVVMIALECGYNSHEAFSRAFQSWAGVSPTQYRERQANDQPVFLPNAQPFTRSEAKLCPILKALPESWLAMKRYIGPYTELAHAFSDLFSALAVENRLSGNPEIVGIAYDDPDLRAPEQLRFDAGLVVKKPSDCPRGFSVTHIPPSQCAVVNVVGRYELLVDGYDAIYRDGAQLVGHPMLDAPAILFYRKMPPAVGLEAAETEIWLPLAPTEPT